MANTTNYNWETPDDTDLVKDGAAAIRTLGSSVDTTTKALNPSTTLGDIEYRSSTANTNTRLGIGTTGQVLTVAGGVPTWATSDDANAIQNAIVDAKGDLISATAADTPARLAVGANGTVLTADSAEATGLKWATPAGGGAGLTLIDEVPFTATSAVNCDSVFTSTYKNYKIMIVGKTSSSNTVTDITFKMRASGSATSTGYNSQRINAYSTTVSTSSNPYGTDEWYGSTLSGNNRGNNGFEMDLYYPQQSSYTSYSGNAFYANAANGTTEMFLSSGMLADTTAYDGMGFLFTDNCTGTIFIYGYAKE